jgi:hypothetical protein
MFLISSQVKKSGQCQLQDKKTPVLFNCFIADPVIVDHAVLLNIQVLIILQQENYELMVL